MSNKGFQARKERRVAARQTRREERRERVAKQQRRKRVQRWLIRAGAVALGLLVVWATASALGVFESEPDSGIPGPQGGSNIAQDIGTLVGQPAPSFTLADADGQEHTVTPGGDSPIVLIFHMGLT